MFELRCAICNEVFEGRPFADAVKAVRKAGFKGFELAPFTLGDDPAAIGPAQRRECRAMIESEGLQFVGLHWLLVTPKTLHVTTPDRAQRDWSWNYVRRLIDLAADLGPDSVMVFGSGPQRASIGGVTEEQATRHFTDGLASLAGHAVERGVTLLVEALSSSQTDVVTSLEEAAAVVRQIDSPGVRTMFDTHNAAEETVPHAELVERHFDLIRHVHVNEMDGRHPGAGTYDFLPVMRVLARRGYAGWISVEAFDFTPGAERIMSESLRHLQSVAERISA